MGARDRSAVKNKHDGQSDTSANTLKQRGLRNRIVQKSVPTHTVAPRASMVLIKVAQQGEDQPETCDFTRRNLGTLANSGFSESRGTKKTEVTHLLRADLGSECPAKQDAHSVPLSLLRCQLLWESTASWLQCEPTRFRNGACLFRSNPPPIPLSNRPAVTMWKRPPEMLSNRPALDALESASVGA